MKIRTPNIRFTVRRIMVLVAVVAILLGVDGMRRRRDRCRELVSWHAMEERSNLYLARAHSETADQDEAGAELHRAAAAAAHGDGTFNEKGHLGFVSSFSAAAAEELRRGAEVPARPLPRRATPQI